jgi:hypothetical protein
MKPLLCAGTVLLIGAAGVFSSSVQEKEADFFAGVLLLQSSTVCTPEQKAEKYKELQVVTGITAPQANILLRRYREKPEEWQKLYALITTLVTQIQTQSKTTAIQPEPCPPQPIKRREPHVGFYRR